jgi:hypothetical protein
VGAGRWGAAVVVVLQFASCREATQIVIEARTNVECPAVFGTTFTVGSPGRIETAPPSAETSACAPDGMIGTLVVVPETAPDAVLSVKIAMRVNAKGSCVPPAYEGCILARRKLRYVPHEQLRLPITLYAQCLGVVCAADRTCDAAGRCVTDTPLCDGDLCKDDGATDAGRDTGGVEPMPDGGDASAQAVACPPDTCVVPEICCWSPVTRSGTCATAATDCLTRTTVSCDGREDCGQGEVCCADSVSSIACRKVDVCPPERTVCNDPSDCIKPGMTCSVDFLGHYKLCALPPGGN